MKWREEGEVYPNGCSICNIKHDFGESTEFAIRKWIFLFSIRFRSWDKHIIRLGYDTGERYDWWPEARPVRTVFNFQW
jgi:hypothetical protein